MKAYEKSQLVQMRLERAGITATTDHARRIQMYDQSKLTHGRVYPFADSEMPTGDGSRHARYTGEIRPPKKGEFFLSGALIEAYRATADMNDPRPIGEPVVICG